MLVNVVVSVVDLTTRVAGWVASREMVGSVVGSCAVVVKGNMLIVDVVVLGCGLMEVSSLNGWGRG